MVNCRKCGAELKNGEKFCPACGATNETAQGGVNNTSSGLNDTSDYTANFDANDINNNQVMAILAYLSWLVLIPLLAAKNSKYARFHANQGLALAIVEIIASCVISILGWLPIVGFIFTLIGGLFSLGCIVLSIIGIINAANGRAKELPIVGKIKILN